MTKCIALALLFALTSCSSPNKGGDKKKTETVPPANVEAPGQTGSKAPGQAVEGKADGVTARLSLQLTLASAGAAADQTPYFVDVQPTFAKCLPCHATGANSPSLASFPFQSKGGDTLDSVLTAVAGRLNNETRPMPPSGLLSPEERQVVSAWIAAGAPAVPSVTPSKELESYALTLSWTAETGANGSVEIAGNEAGTFDLALGTLPAGTHLTVKAKVTGPKGRVVFDTAFASLSLPASGVLSLPLRATSVDQKAPVLGTPVVRATAQTQTSAKLSWEPATDDSTAPQNLVYSVTLDGATLVAKKDLTSYDLTGLTPGTKYLASVSVTDEEGNAASYGDVVVLTLPMIVQAQITAQLNLVQPGDTAAPLLTFTDVQTQFGKCMPCHAHGEKSPDLSSFPFVGKPGESLASVMAKIAQRTSDASSPMPQTGLLPLAEREQIAAWISTGYLTLPPASTPSPELGAYKVELRWTSEAGSSDWVALPRSNQGNYALAAGSMPVGTAVVATVRVTGPRSTIVLEKTFAALSLPTSGRLSLPLRATAVDVTAPVAGQQGDVRGSNLTHEALSLKWTEGRDLVSAAGSLRYTVYQAQTNSLDTVANIKANGTQISATTAALTSFDVTGLTPSTSYYFNVIVEDQAGNEAAYHTYSVTTEDDPNAPVVTEYPNCITQTPTRQRVQAWRNAAAQDLETGTSESTIAQRIKQCFPTEVPQCIKPVLGYALRDDIASASADGPVAQSPQRLPPKELLAPGGNGLQWIIPSNVEEIARANGWPVVRYKSRHAGGFDPETPNLLMVYVPGDKVSPPVNYDRWLNFATPKDSNATALTPLPQAPLAQDEDFDAGHNFGAGMPRVFTMVSLDRPQGGNPAQVYFQMFDRESSGPKFSPRSNSNVESCVSCHPNGLRAISPLGLHVRANEAQLPVEDWFAAQVINDAMDSAAGKKAVSWRTGKVNGVAKPFFNPADQGPVLGLEVPLNDSFSRSKAFIMGGTLPNGQSAAGCFNRRTTVSVRDIFGRAPGLNNVYTLSANPNIRWDKVRDSMKCATCHNNVDRGALNSTMDMSQVDFKILVDQSMPSGAHINPLDTVDGVPGDADRPVKDDLTADERIALANCVAAEFQLERQFLAKSLSQTRCE